MTMKSLIQMDNLNMTDVSPPKPVKSSIVKVVGFICTFLLSWQALFRIPDGAIGVLLKFIRLTLLKLSEITGCEDLKTIHKLFPNSLKQARRLQSINCDDFRRLVVCKVLLNLRV